MAKRPAATANRTATKKRKERRTFVPASTILNPEEHVSPVTEMPAETQAFGFGRKSSRQGRTIGVPIDTNYGYVSRDLRKIMFTGSALVAVLVGLAFVIH